MMKLSEEMLRDVRERLPQFADGRRLEHIYAVEQECGNLAKLFLVYPSLFSSEDELRLRLAALLHDLTKQKTMEDQLALCSALKIRLTPYERVTKKVLHAKTGAELARRLLDEWFGRIDGLEPVFSAVLCHTTGKADMTLIEKLLYLADYIEPTRTFSDCQLLRQRFYQDIQEAGACQNTMLARLDDVLLLAFDLTIKDLLENEKLIHEDTLAGRNFILYSRMTTAACGSEYNRM